MERLTIFVDSFDGYNDMWEIYFKIFNHYWPDCKYKKVLVNNELKPNLNDVEVMNTGIERNWMFRTIKALQKINTKYILFTLEDYFIGKRVNNDDIEEILDFMEENEINCYKLYPWPRTKKKFTVGNKDYLYAYTKKDAYAINGSLAIFKTKFLLDILMKCENAESCFDFEYYYLYNKQNINDHVDFSLICYDSRNLLGYHNGIIRGKWLRSTIKYYKKENINIDFSQRKKMSIKQTFFYLIRFNAPNFIKKFFRLTIKNSSLGLK